MNVWNLIEPCESYYCKSCFSHNLISMWNVSITKNYLIFDILIQRRKHFTMKWFVLSLRLKIRTFINLTTKTSTRKGGDDRISLLRQPHSNFFHIRSKTHDEKSYWDLRTCITFHKVSKKKVLSYHFFMFNVMSNFQ